MFSQCCFEAGVDSSPIITSINQSLPSYGATANPAAASFFSPKARRAPLPQQPVSNPTATQASLPHQPQSSPPDFSDQYDTDDEHPDVYVIYKLQKSVRNPLSYSSGASSEVKPDLLFSPKYKPKSRPVVAPHVMAYVESAPPRRDRDSSRFAATQVRTGSFFSQYTPTEHDVKPLLHSDPLRPNYTYATSHYEDLLPAHNLKYSVPQNSKDGLGSLNLFNEHATRILQQRASENKQKTVYQFIKENRLQQVPQRSDTPSNQENRPRPF